MLREIEPDAIELALMEISMPMLDSMLLSSMAAIAQLASKCDKKTKAHLVRLAWEMLKPNGDVHHAQG